MPGTALLERQAVLMLAIQDRRSCAMLQREIRLESHDYAN